MGIIAAFVGRALVFASGFETGGTLLFLIGAALVLSTIVLVNMR